LARRPASHPPDQCQGSAVTYVALCVVSDIAMKSAFFYVQWLRARHGFVLQHRCDKGRYLMRVSGIGAKPAGFVYGDR
ncbi:hypothetical protein ALQ64_05347, partial [Pseudomonas cannabina]